MNHIKDCKDCITYAICRSNLIERIVSSVETRDKNFNVMGSYSYIVVTRCGIQRDSIENAISQFRNKGYEYKEINYKVTDLILEVFDIDYEGYLQRASGETASYNG